MGVKVILNKRLTGKEFIQKFYVNMGG